MNEPKLKNGSIGLREIRNLINQRGPILLQAYAILSLTMVSADFAAIDGLRAKTLGLPMAWLVSGAPLVVLLSYLALGLVLKRVLRTFGWVMAYFLSPLVLLLLVQYVTVSTRSIALSRWLESKDKAALEAVFKHPYAHYAAGKGIRLDVRRSDYNDSLPQFLESIHALKKQ